MDISTISKKPTIMKQSTEESNTDTCEPLQTHLNKALSLTTTTTNGPFKPCSGHHQPPPPQDMVGVYSYKECLKNHAAKLGGLALDGCGEFLQNPHSTPLDPTSLTCAACGCHRNFHRRHPFLPPTITATAIHHLPPPLNWSSSPGSSSPNGSPLSSPISAMAPQNMGLAPYHLKVQTSGSGVMRKRSRTKFTEEQKAKMLAFAETLGWKMVAMRGSGSEHERMVSDFCNEVGVRRDVFKVWMHNNKHRRGKVQGFDGGSEQKCSDDDVNGSNDDNESKVCIFGNNVGQYCTSINNN